MVTPPSTVTPVPTHTADRIVLLVPASRPGPPPVDRPLLTTPPPRDPPVPSARGNDQVPDRRGPEATIRGLGWWPPPGPLRQDLLILLGVAVLLSLVLPDRSDWASHLVAGGGIVLAVAGRLGPRLGAWAATLGVVLVLVVSAAVDLTLTGPFDPADVAFTVLGGLLVTGEVGAATTGAAGPAAPTGTAVRAGSSSGLVARWGVALAALALVHRYGIWR
jgi:hypothetical protein